MVAMRAEAASDHSGAMLARATAALFVRVHGGDRTAGLVDQEWLRRTALPLEEERGDSRRLALFWRVLAYSANFRMQNDEDVQASRQALHYSRLAGDFPSDTAMLDLALILGPRPADEALRALEEIGGNFPPGATDLGRATLLAMLGRADEAWPLAEARSSHVRDVSGGSSSGAEYLALMAEVEGDRERACRHTAELIGRALGSDGVMASWKSMLARDLFYLDRFDEAKPLLAEARAVGWSPIERTLVPAVEALFLARVGEFAQAEERARAAVVTAETEADNVWLQGWANEDLATVLERAGRTDEARAALERALAPGNRNAACRSSSASVSRSTRLGPRSSRTSP